MLSSCFQGVIRRLPFAIVLNVSTIYAWNLTLPLDLHVPKPDSVINVRAEDALAHTGATLFAGADLSTPKALFKHHGTSVTMPIAMLIRWRHSWDKTGPGYGFCTFMNMFCCKPDVTSEQLLLFCEKICKLVYFHHIVYVHLKVRNYYDIQFAYCTALKCTPIVFTKTGI